MAYKCRSCYQPGHLQDTCPREKNHPKKKNGWAHNKKGWKPFDPYLIEEEEGEITENSPNQEEWISQIQVGIATHKKNGTKVEVIHELEEKKNVAHKEDGEISSKRVHVSKSSYLDKEHPLEIIMSDLVMVLDDPNSTGW